MLQTCVQAVQALAVVFGLVWQVLKVRECARAASAVLAVECAIGAAPVAAGRGRPRVVGASARVEPAHQRRYPVVHGHVGWEGSGGVWGDGAAVAVESGRVRWSRARRRLSSACGAVLVGAGGSESGCAAAAVAATATNVNDEAPYPAGEPCRDGASTRHQMITGGSLGT